MSAKLCLRIGDAQIRYLNSLRNSRDTSEYCTSNHGSILMRWRSWISPLKLLASSSQKRGVVEASRHFK
jgi:hypothetical protein